MSIFNRSYNRSRSKTRDLFSMDSLFGRVTWFIGVLFLTILTGTFFAFYWGTTHFQRQTQLMMDIRYNLEIQNKTLKIIADNTTPPTIGG